MSRRLILLTLGFALGACAPSADGPSHTVQPETFRLVVTERGTVGSEREVKLAAPFSGKVDTLLPEGTTIRPGLVVATMGVDEHKDRWERARLKLEQKRLEQPLATIKGDFEVWRLTKEAENAERGLAIAKLKFQQLKLGRAGTSIVEAAEAIGTLEAEKAIATATVPEAQKLLEKGYMAEEELRTMRARMAEIQAELKALRVKLKALEHGPRQEEIGLERLKVEQAASAASGAKKKLKAAQVARELNVEAAALELKRAKEDEAYRAGLVKAGTLVAPATGVLIYETFWTGSEVAKLKAGDSVEHGTQLVTISDPTRQVVRVNVDAAAAVDLVPNMPVRCRFDAFPALTVDGHVRTIAPVAAPRLQGDLNQIQTIEVHVALDRPDTRLKAGMSANLEFVLAEEPNRLVVPTQAIAKGAEPAVSVRDGHRWVRRPVTLGRSNERLTVVLSGLNPGDQVSLQAPEGGR